MLLPVHDALYEAALALATGAATSVAAATGRDAPPAVSADAERAFLRTARFPHSSPELLRVGLRYPDLPCATRARDPRAAHGVRHADYRLCPVTKLARLLQPRAGRAGESYSEAYASHKYSLAHQHAMSWNPRLTAAEVRDLIVDFCGVCAALAVADTLGPAADGRAHPPRAFWLGQLLHCVQDAYSPSHVLRGVDVAREARRAGRPAAQLMRALRLVSDAGVVRAQYADLSLDAVSWVIERAAVTAAAAGSGRAPPPRDPQAVLEAEMRRRGVGGELFKPKSAVALFLAHFAYARARAAVARRGGRGAKRAASAASDAPPALPPLPPLRADHRVVGFYCYTAQAPYRHLKRDTERAARKRGLWEPAVRDSAWLLRRYAAALDALAAVEEDGGEGEGRVAAAARARRAARVRDAFVADVRGLLLRKTLALAPGAETLLTGLDPREVADELLL